jgi:hypothetical protein
MLHSGQQQVLRQARRFNTVACGRRYGKTTLGLALAYYGAPHAPGGLSRGLDVGWFAPSYKLLDEAWRGAKAFLRTMVARTDSQQHRMELRNGAAMDFWTLEDVDAGRGRKYGLVVVDEAAMARHLEEAWNAAIRPTLTDLRGGAWFFSTPKGRNFFWQLHQRGQRDAEWQAHHAPSAANPTLDEAEIEAARQSLPERIFAQEYLAQFLEDGGGVFRRVTAAVDSSLVADPHLARPVRDGRAYVIGVDWGRHNDWTVICVLDAREKAVVAVDRFTQIDYAIQMQRLRAMSDRFPGAQILAESNSMGGPLVEALQSQMLPVRAFQTTHASKSSAIEALALAFERGELRLPPVQWLVDELISYEQERLPSGGMRYGAPSGGHDDGVMALAIAWHGVNAGSSAPSGAVVSVL